MTEEREQPSENGDSLRTISEGASLFFVGKVVSNGLGFLFNLILTQTLGAALFGIYTYANSIAGFLIVFARFGTGKSLMRFIPSYDGDVRGQNSVTALAYLTALCGSITIGAALFLGAPIVSKYTLNEPLLVDVLQILAIVLPFNTITNLTNSVFRALEKLEYQVLISNITEPLLRIISVSIAFVLGYSLIGAVAALAVGAVLTFCAAISFLYTKTELRPTRYKSDVDVREFYNFSLPLTLKDLGQKLYTRVDILMVGFFLTGSAVGIYRVSILVATLLTLPLAGVNQLFPPIVSGLYTEGKVEELEATYQIVTRWVFTLVLPAALALISYSSQVLRIFGPEFSEGAVILSLFTVAQLTNCAVGPSGFLLMMTDHQYLNLANQWVLGILNVVLNYTLILEYGFIGAAAATAGTLTFINLVRVLEVWHTEQMLPYSHKYWKPLLAGGCSILIMVGWRILLDGYTLLVVGSATGMIAFVGILVVSGIEKEDREFYVSNIRPRFK
jgi:O-antigen/teichoic acid export membrane protein